MRKTSWREATSSGQFDNCKENSNYVTPKSQNEIKRKKNHFVVIGARDSLSLLTELSDESQQICLQGGLNQIKLHERGNQSKILVGHPNWSTIQHPHACNCDLEFLYPVIMPMELKLTHHFSKCYFTLIVDETSMEIPKVTLWNLMIVMILYRTHLFLNGKKEIH